VRVAETGARPVCVLTHLPEGLLARVCDEVPEATLCAIPQEGPIPDDARGEVLFTLTWGAPNLAQALERGVRWVHTFGTGVDRFPFDLLGERPLACARGASAGPIAEWVLAVMLAAEKKLPQAWTGEPRPRWSDLQLGGLRGRTLGLIGLGGIGQEVARLALAFGMRVLAHRRSDKPSPLAGIDIVPLDKLLEASDHLVVAAPATRETRHLLGRDAFALVKPGVHLVNIARGALVDQDALREALDDGRVALASLDTVEPEPPPDGHWLYTHPRVRLSAHVSWNAPGALDQLLDSFIANLKRYLAGEPLRDLVDVEAGY
jgi:phosphoglycerate dehydrogenase-like enzyme